MVPMAELAEQPMWLNGPYLYWHERGAYSEERKRREGAVKTWRFTQPVIEAGDARLAAKASRS